MEEMLYCVADLAELICEENMTNSQMDTFLTLVWQNEKEYLPQEYRQKERKFYLDVMEAVDNQMDWDSYQNEMDQVNADLEAIGSETILSEEEYEEQFQYFFIRMRLRILYLDGPDYCRMKMRTLLQNYGYQRRTKHLLKWIKECLFFYHIEVTIAGGETCDLEEVSLNQMLVFRVVGHTGKRTLDRKEKKEQLPRNFVATAVCNGVEHRMILTDRYGRFRYSFLTQEQRTGLTELTLPNGMTGMKVSLKERYPNLTDLFYEGTEEEWETVSKNMDVGDIQIHIVGSNGIR
ncbi:MAG: hypothetical protein ACI4HI_13200 [Lachnospiraceae bacterium]